MIPLGVSHSRMTIFTIPKPFIGRNDIFQRNALKSWLALSSNPEIILCGDDEGVGEVCEELGLTHISDIKKNEYENYFLDDTFTKASQRASGGLMCYVNADIILTEDFEQAVTIVEKNMTHKKGFLMTGNRWNFDMSENNYFDIGVAYKYGSIQPPYGSDFFLYPRVIHIPMPAFVVGRPCWDNWMFYFFRHNKIPMIDISKFTLVFHPNHDYSHVKNGYGDRWEGPEGDANKKIMDELALRYLFLTDADHILTKEGKLKKQYARIFRYNLSPSSLFRDFYFLVQKLKIGLQKFL